MTSGFLDKKTIEALFGQSVDSVHMLVICVDVNGNILYVNSHFLNITGYTVEEVAGKNLYDLFVPVNKIETVVKKNQAIIQNSYSMQSENPILKKDGNQITIEWHNMPVTIKNTQAVLSFGFDITSRIEVELLLSLNEKTMRDRADVYEKQNKVLEDTKIGMLNLLEDSKKLEEELQLEKKNVEKKVEERTYELNQEKARLMAAINSFPYGFLVLDSNDEVVLVNEKLESIFNVRRIKWQLSDLEVFLGDVADFKENYDKVKRSKKPVLIKDIDLARKFLEVYISPIFLNQLSFDTIGHVILVSDITEQKIIERSKDEFFSIASHELRTPLTAIRGNAEMMQKYFSSKVEDPAFNEILEDIQSSSERLINLVNEFLNMSRLEQGKMMFYREKADICEIISDVVGELQTNATNKNLYLKFDGPPNTKYFVYCDINRLHEVLINLIGNAISYTDKGGCTVTVEKIDDNVKVSVTDTGKGIPLQNQNLLFRKFQQANMNIYTRDVARSSGLGLYISKLIMEAMQGTIYLEKSALGIGSTFVFTLPVA